MDNRIVEMEQRLEKITVATAELQENLNKLQQLKSDARTLFSYYGSEDWYKDREAHSAIVDNRDNHSKGWSALRRPGIRFYH